MKYSWFTLMWAGETMDTMFNRISKNGYDGAEILGEPDRMDIKAVKKLLDKHGLECSTVCCITAGDRQTSSVNEKIRKNAVEHLKKCVKMAHGLNCETVFFPAGGVFPPPAPKDKMWAAAKESITEAAKFAENYGVRLAIEAINRYENPIIYSLDHAVKMAKEINMDNVGAMGDTFHMNIEEADIGQAIRNAGKLLFHQHIADSNRRAAGLGHIDFKAVMRALRDINYKYYLTMETLPPFTSLPTIDEYPFIKFGDKNEMIEFYDEYCEKSIKYLKIMEESI